MVCNGARASPLSDGDLEEAVEKILAREVEAAGGKTEKPRQQAPPKTAAESGGSETPATASPADPNPKPELGTETADETETDALDEEDANTPAGEDVPDEAEIPAAAQPTKNPDGEPGSLGTQAGESKEIQWSEAIYGELDREAIQRVLGSLNRRDVTPRRIRSFTLRYQLARLILRELKENPDPDQILTQLTNPEGDHDEIPFRVQVVADAVCGRTTINA